MQYVKSFLRLWQQQNIPDDLNFIFTMLLGFLLVPIACYYVVGLLGRLSDDMAGHTFGRRTQLIFGGVGATINELSKMACAFIFGHNVFQDHSRMMDSWEHSYGLVGTDHNWEADNIVQDMGSLIIGISPLYICSLVIYGIQRFLMGDPMTGLAQGNVRYIGRAAMESLGSCFAGANIFTFLVFFVLVVMIASTGFSSSRLTMVSTSEGIFTWAVFIILLTAVLCICGVVSVVAPYADAFLAWTVFISVRAIVYTVLSLLITSIFMVLNRTL